ncbi:MAG TPA: hypothetical protein VFF78_08490 [Anaerolineaceae bacterium]|nr:hypothetical protein [Anaerolineaceae bacterium]
MTHWKQDFRSKIIDGFVPANLLFLFSVTLGIMVAPIQNVFGRPGLLIYTLSLLAVSIVCLERSIVTRYLETWRAWYGAVGGLLAWTVIELINSFGAKALTSESGILTFIVVALVAGVLWKRVLPIGVQFFVFILLLSWGGHLVLVEQVVLQNIFPFLATSYQITGWVGVGGIVVGLAWLFSESETRIQRLWVANWLWFCAMIVIYVFRGGIA